MSKTLLVLTEQFPYGNGETFLESEMLFWDTFDRVIVCPLSSKENGVKKRAVEKCELIEISISKLKKIIEIPKLLFDQDFWEEFEILKQKSANKYESFKKLLSMTLNMRIEARQIIRYLKDNIKADDQLFLYAYWLYNPAYVAVTVKKHIPQVERAISRAHGFDIYEYRSFNYLPYRQMLFEELDAVYCVSNNGVNYLNELYPLSSVKFHCAYLGTIDYGTEIFYRQSNTIRIVSCSNCIKLKRINLIIDALSQLRGSGLLIEWTHFGGGPLLDALKIYASEQLDEFVTFTFAGPVSNSELMNKYKSGQYDFFINVSETEGIPVSIMEAMSFGIPALATDVGGTSELVNDGINGYLVGANTSFVEIANKIQEIALLDTETYLNLRINARRKWEMCFSAKKNYPKFCDKLIIGSEE